MSDRGLLDSVQFVVDSGGHRSAVLLGIDVWEQVLTLIEDLEDAEEIRRARALDEESIPWEQVKAGGDLMKALADRYFMRRVPPAWFRPSRERIDFVIKLAGDFKVGGVLWYQLMYRDGYDLQHHYFERIMDKDLGLKTLKVESDYDSTEIGPLRTRVEAFVETIRR